MADGDVKHSEEHCDVEGEEPFDEVCVCGSGEFDSLDDDSFGEISVSEVDKVFIKVNDLPDRLFLFSCWDDQCDLSRALRTFSTVHTLSSWGDRVAFTPGRFNDKFRDWSFSSSTLSEISRSDESSSVVWPIVSASGSPTLGSKRDCWNIFLLDLLWRFFADPTAFVLVAPTASCSLTSASFEREIERRPIRCLLTATDCRGSLYVWVPVFQSLK